MKVVIRNPRRRELETHGDRSVQDLLRELDIPSESVLVLKDGEMVTRHERLRADDTVEIVSAMSGGAS